MIDAELLKKKINELRTPEYERLKVTGGVLSDGYVLACDDILKLIDTLNGEQNT